MATFIRKLLGHFGNKREEVQRPPIQRPEGVGNFGMKMAVPVESTARVPVVSQSAYGNGGVQGLRWYSERLRVDHDGDVAEEFLSEVVPKCRESSNSAGTPPRLESVSETKPAILKGPVFTRDGNVLHIVETSSTALSAA